MSIGPPEPAWRTVAPDAPDYPALLLQLDSPPPLAVRGTLDAQAPTVAIVGSRKSTPYGEEIAFEIAKALAGTGIVVVSGLARGIDACAHRGALAGGGSTVAVMGTGPDTIYPYRHRELAAAISRSGALVTQFAERTPPLPGNFPARNAVISGMSLGVVVVEAARRSGAILTASAAGQQGRVVMAVPGNVYSPTSQGCHDLLRDGAVLVTCAEEVLAELKTEPLRSELAARPAGVEVPRFGDTRDLVMKLVLARPLTLEQLCRLTGTPARAVALAAAQLRVDGFLDVRGGLFRPSGGVRAARSA